MGVPVEAETLRFVANELNLCIHLAQTRWLQRMLRSVKDEDFAVDAKSSNNVRVLRLITCFVDFSRMLNPLYDVALEGGNIACLSISSNLASFLVVVVGVRRHGFGYLDIGDLKEVGTVVRSVCSEQKTVHAIVFALGFLDVREPLNGERGPGQGSPGAERLEQPSNRESLQLENQLTQESCRIETGCSSSTSCTLYQVEIRGLHNVKLGLGRDSRLPSLMSLSS